MITSDGGLLPPSGDSCKLTDEEDFCQKAGEIIHDHAFEWTELLVIKTLRNHTHLVKLMLCVFYYCSLAAYVSFVENSVDHIKLKKTLNDRRKIILYLTRYTSCKFFSVSMTFYGRFHVSMSIIFV